MTYRFLNTRTRKIEWKGPGVKKTREFAVTELYPRVMYTFSDVVVFVLQNQRYVIPTYLNRLTSTIPLEYFNLPHSNLSLNGVTFP